MTPSKLDMDALAVDSFATSVPQTDSTDTANYLMANNACTGCVSGCGIISPDPALA